MPLAYATDDKDHLKELEFYKNLAKAASLASQNNNNNNSNSNNNNININNNDKSPLPHQPSQHLKNNNSINLTSPATSPQPMQIVDTDDQLHHHTINDESDNHRRQDDDVHNLTDNDTDMTDHPTDQAKASALAAAAAAAQAHLNGTSEYISKSNFICIYKQHKKQIYGNRFLERKCILNCRLHIKTKL